MENTDQLGSVATQEQQAQSLGLLAQVCASSVLLFWDVILKAAGLAC